MTGYRFPNWFVTTIGNDGRHMARARAPREPGILAQLTMHSLADAEKQRDRPRHKSGERNCDEPKLRKGDVAVSITVKQQVACGWRQQQDTRR